MTHLNLLKTVLAYSFVGAVSVTLAVYLSTLFLRPGATQTVIKLQPQNSTAQPPSAASPRPEEFSRPSDLAEPSESDTEDNFEPPENRNEGKPAADDNSTQSQENSATQVSDQEAGGAAQLLQQFFGVYDYKPEGRRDPFRPYLGAISTQGSVQGPVLPLQRFDLDKLQIMGIIWDVVDPKVMFRDPTGKVHIVGLETKIGRNNGYIKLIREGEVIIVEPVEDQGKILYSTRVLKLLR